MILKGNARSFGSDLASHLLNLYDNDEVEVAELTGTQATDLHGAFAEFEAVASGTRCVKHLYSLSINPAQPLTREQYAQVIDRIGEKLGLADQPRAVVFHHKQGADGVVREHCHVVWSRIDVSRMRAVQLSHDRQKLRSVAQELAAEFEHPLPEGLARNKGAERFNGGRDVAAADQARAETSGLKADERRTEITAAWNATADGKAFRAALEERGYYLARGDKRGFVVVDRAGHIHSLPRQISGVRTKDVRERFEPLTPDYLPDLAQVKARVAKIAEDEAAYEDKLPRLRRSPDELKARQAGRRAGLMAKMQELELRQRSERLTLHQAQEQERRRPFARAARAVMGVVNRVPVLRSVLGKLALRPVRSLDERHRQENEALDRRYENEVKPLQGQVRALDKIEQRENRSLALDQKRLRQAETMRARRAGSQLLEQFGQSARDAEQEKGDELADRQKEVKRRLEEAERRQRDHVRRPRGPGM